MWKPLRAALTLVNHQGDDQHLDDGSGTGGGDNTDVCNGDGDGDGDEKGNGAYNGNI